MRSTKTFKAGAGARRIGELERQVANLATERRGLLELALFVRHVAAQPCEIGHLDARRCFEHAHTWPKKNWCHPCAAGATLRARTPDRKTRRK